MVQIGGKLVAIKKIVKSIKSLNREVVYFPYAFTAILVDQEDRAIVE
jgi:hypothetical protein